MSGRGEPPFFVGYLNKVEPPLSRFLMVAAIAIVGGAALLGFVLGARNADGGSGAISGEVRLAGLIETRPYPLLRVPPSPGQPEGRAIMLAGEDKTGLQAEAAARAGRPVELQGFVVKRGSLDMLLVGPAGIASSPAAVTGRPAAQPRGRWRLTGEICDGKCTAGAMRPGSGLAHKACANLCIAGGVPPVFVVERPVEGAGFLLLADRDGGPAPDRLFDLLGQPVALEGEVEKLDDLLILKADWSAARIAR